MSDPGGEPKRQIGERIQAKDYFTRKGNRKGGIDAKTFSMVIWEEVESVLRETSKT